MKAQYIDHMGDDLAIVNAAKVSFGKRSEWAEVPHWVNTKFGCDEYEGDYVLSKKDQGLIQFLARGCTSGDWNKALVDVYAHCDLCVTDPRLDYTLNAMLTHIRRMPSHWSPFAHTAISLHLKMPIFVARQIMKHTTGIEYNEISRRYVDSDPEFYVPDVWRKKADNVKQGSSDEAVDLGRFPYEPYCEDWTLPDGRYGLNELLLEVYKDMLAKGVAPEQARMILPQSMYTEVIATGNLYAWANLYVQRTDSHAQKETQDLAKQIGEIIQPLYPVSWEALCGGIQNHLNEVERLAK